MKKILQRIALRTLELKVFNLLPDKLYLYIKYFCKMGKILNLKNPKTFNEKIQWLKINDRKSTYTKMVDKCDAKEYVANKIGDEYIIPTIGIYDSFDDINFEELPNEFVLKCTHDSGGVIICKDKSLFDKKSAKKRINKTFNKNYFYNCREWPYKNIKPRILVEKYMLNENEEELINYKFWCFNGEPKFMYISQCMKDHNKARISYLDTDYNETEFQDRDYKHFEELPKKPKNFEKMLEIAKVLSKGITFIRVDLYEVENRVYFGELTFYPNSGYIHFKPEECDEKIGNLMILPKVEKDIKKLVIKSN